MQPVPLCRHIKINGNQCQSPALRQQPYCYFHEQLHRNHRPYHTIPGSSVFPQYGEYVELPPLEDLDSVQLALSLVVNALGTGRLESRRCSVLLYGLQLASNNASAIQARLPTAPCVREVEVTPEGADLAPAGATLDLDAAPPTPQLEAAD